VEKIVSDSLSESIFVLRNDFGGNIGVLVGDDGILLIDSHRKDFKDSIQSEISKISSLPVEYLINTHWHFDHIENNETFANQGAIIISHENCRARLSGDQVIPIFMPRQDAIPEKGLPKITFHDSLNIYINDEIVNVFHLENAHTNSDVVVYFRRSNIFHMGDIFVRYGVPFIDVENGGSVDGMIAACEYIISSSNESTQIIPGHGPVSNIKDLIEYTDMLITIRNRIAKGIESRYSLEQIIKSNPAEEYESIVEKASLIELYYNSLTKNL
jgi:glyoxylase-like metal-dependent hydrolase (beta-lactamase superfamily II)